MDPFGLAYNDDLLNQSAGTGLQGPGNQPQWGAQLAVLTPDTFLDVGLIALDLVELGQAVANHDPVGFWYSLGALALDGGCLIAPVATGCSIPYRAAKEAGELGASGAAKAGKNATDPFLEEGAEYSVRLDPKTGRPMAVDSANFTSGAKTKNGGIRENRQFWRQWRETYGETLGEANLARIKEGKAPIIDDLWIQHYPEHSRYIGQPLVHHHLDYGRYAIPLPQSIHRSPPGRGIWHQ